MATKYNLPNASGTTSNLTAELTEYERLYKLKPRTQTGNVTFTSLTSGTVYSTTVYGGGAYNNTGEQGMLNILYDVLLPYMLVADDFNGKADTAYVDTQVGTKATFKNGSGTFPSGQTSYQITDAFITTNTLVVISPTQTKVGTWTVASASGSFTITSSATETSTVTFDWSAIK